MVTFDKDYYFERLKTLPVYNLIRLIWPNIPAFSQDIFKRVFVNTSEIVQITVRDSSALEQLVEYFTVWYTVNENGGYGAILEGCRNYRLSEFIDLFPNIPSYSTHRSETLAQIQSVISSIEKNGIMEPIIVLVAYDSVIGKGVIVDGSKRSTALCYTMKKGTLRLKETDSVDIVILTSPCCRLLFPFDFLKV